MPAKVKVRFAPSPTGYLHVGAARTALFNWLWARHTGGEFLLRIEDTDTARLVDDAEEQIKEALTWLGLEWDGPVIRQSERLEVYRKVAQRLIDSGHAYESTEDSGTVTRFKWPDEQPDMTVKYFDTGRRQEKRTFSKADAPTAFEDFVLIKSDGYPTYNFAHVVDDHDQGITHVIRGDEFVSSLNKYVALHAVLDWPVPSYVHVPPILGPDKAKLSKRHGAQDVLEYRVAGYLPDALANFIALIGWSPGGDRELFWSLDELAETFDLGGIQKSPGVFDEEKLRWLNGEHLKRLDTGALIALAEAGRFWKGKPSEFDVRVIELESSRIKTLAALSELKDSFYYRRPKLTVEAFSKEQPPETITTWLETAMRQLEKLPDSEWQVANLENQFTDIREELGLTPKQLFPVIRVALTGAPQTPTIWELCWAFGKEGTLARLEMAAALVA